jgi:hypothetical protein
VPRLLHERQEPVADGEQQERHGEDGPAAQPVDDRTAEGDRRDAGDRARRDDQADGVEPESADVVQVDEQEREGEPVAERVCEPAELHRPDGARESRIEAAEVVEHAGLRLVSRAWL